MGENKHLNKTDSCDISFDATKVSSWFKDGDFKNHIINEKNIPITENFINGMFKKYNFKHKVQNLENFQMAMIHVSYMNRSTLTEKTAKMLRDVLPISLKDRKNAMPLVEQGYDRFEFLGDSVIHWALTDYLFERYPKEGAGFLTKLRTKIERAEMLSKLSKDIGLDKYAVVARNIEQSDGRESNTHLTEDLFEAFFGALSKEIPPTECKKLLINIIEEEIDMAELINNEDNFKEQLMQYFHQKKLGEPTYREDVSQQKTIKDGCAETKFFVSYAIGANNEILGVGSGNAKIKSEQLAAYQALIKLNAIKYEDDSNDFYGELSDDDSDGDESGKSDDESNGEPDNSDSDCEYSKSDSDSDSD